QLHLRRRIHQNRQKWQERDRALLTGFPDITVLAYLRVPDRVPAVPRLDIPSRAARQRLKLASVHAFVPGCEAGVVIGEPGWSFHHRNRTPEENQDDSTREPERQDGFPRRGRAATLRPGTSRS